MLIAGNDERNVAAWESDRRILSNYRGDVVGSKVEVS